MGPRGRWPPASGLSGWVAGAVTCRQEGWGGTGLVWVAGRGEGEKEEILSLSCLRGTRGLGGVAGPWGWGWRGGGSRALREVCPISKPQACSPAGGSRVQQPAGSAKATAGGSELGACLPTAPAAPRPLPTREPGTCFRWAPGPPSEPCGFTAVRAGSSQVSPSSISASGASCRSRRLEVLVHTGRAPTGWWRLSPESAVPAGGGPGEADP